MNFKSFYWIFCPKAAQYTFFSAAHVTFSKIDILGHKESVNIEENGNNLLYFIRLQWNTTRNQMEVKLQKIFKYMESE
jgi:hypothetical protein